MPAAIDRCLCIHCGTPFRPTEHRPKFCCAGCQFVYELIGRNGLDQFYDLQSGEVQPVKSFVFHTRDYRWLEELIDASASEQSLLLDVQGVSCLACVWLIERIFNRHPGALSIRVDPVLGQMALQWEPRVFDVLAFARELQSFGYLVGPAESNRSKTDRGLTIRLGLCAALSMNTMLFTLPGYLGMEAGFQFAELFRWLTLALGTLSFVIGGSYFANRSWRSLKEGTLHIDVPISLGLGAAWLGSLYAWSQGAQSFVYFDFVSTFVFLMLVGRWLQQKAASRNRNQLLAMQAKPQAVQAPDGSTLAIENISVGDPFLVDPGHIVPVRGRLCSEAASLGLEWINGESEAVLARQGSIVRAGATNCGLQPIAIEALETWKDSFLAKLLNVTPSNSTRDLHLERFIHGYLWTVITLAIVGFLVWLRTGAPILSALQVFISVLVVSCPCASGVALPMCSDLAAARVRRLGVFVRNSEIWGRLNRVRKIIFDKTGTLTLESISLQNPEELQGLNSNEKAVLLAMVLQSEHPVSLCIREQLLADGIEPCALSDLDEAIGYGLETSHSDAKWRLGRSTWASASCITNAQVPFAAECTFTRNGQTLARFHFGEQAREGAREEIAALRDHTEVFVLSGDRGEKVAAMANRLGIPLDHCLGGLSPTEKANEVQRLGGEDALYLGDGANDALAFESASVTGTPAVDRGLLEQKADFYFLGRGLSGLRHLLAIAARRRRTVHAVLTFTITYNAVVVAMSLAGRMTPLLAAILMPSSSLASMAIVFTGLRVRR